MHVVHDGASAIDYLKRGSPTHVVILDLNLPGMSGYDVLSHIKHDVQLRQTPVVVLTPVFGVDQTFVNRSCRDP